MNWGEFFAMGGKAMYVWPSWGMALLVIACNWLWPVLQRRRLIRRLRRDAELRGAA